VAVALDRLPPAQRAAMVLRYMDDLPVRQVAQAMARTESAVESLLSRGRDALRRNLGEESR
jgi:RNA polymerase sigma factor (sigma-70 family)